MPVLGDNLGNVGSNVDLTTEVTGILPIANGGTGDSTTEKTDFRKFYGYDKVSTNGVGTWAKTRAARGLWVLRHTAAAETTILGIDITEVMRSTASKGLKLNSIDVIFENATADLNALTATLDRILYIDSEAETVTNIPLTGSLGVGQDADPQIDTLTVTTPAYATAGHKYVLEISVNAALTSAYDFIGVQLNFARNDL